MIEEQGLQEDVTYIVYFFSLKIEIFPKFIFIGV